MHRFPKAARALVASGLLLLLAACGGTTAPAPGALVDIGAGVRGPAGLAATVVATGLEHASVITVDDAGRTWIATAAFEDTGTDVVAVIDAAGGAPRTVLDHLHTPLGLLWLDGELYVAAKGGVVAHGGFDGTGFASSRTVLDLPADIGEVNGLARHPDGRLLVGVSAPCDHCTPASDRSAAILAFAAHGDAPASVYASAIRAPIALAFLPGTTELLVTMNHRDDLGDATPGDWLAVVAEGSNWAFPACPGTAPTACDGVPAPLAALDPHAGLSGLALVTDELGPGLAHVAIVAEWAGGVVQQVALDGAASRTGTVRPFLTGMHNPTAVALDGHGGVLVADWTTGTVVRITRAA